MKTLHIETTRPVITANTTPAKVDITSKRRTFKVSRTPTRMKVESQAPTMRVNWNKTNGQMGRRSPEVFRQYLYSLNRHRVSSAIERTSSEGSQVGHVENYVGSKSDPFAQIALQRMDDERPEVNVSSMPQERADVSWTPGSLHVDWTIGELEIEWDNDFMPEFDVTPYSIDIRLQGRPAVHIKLNEENIQAAVGRKVNQKI